MENPRELELEKPKRKLIECVCEECGKFIGRFVKSDKICVECRKKKKKDRWKAIINPILGFTPIKNMKMK